MTSFLAPPTNYSVIESNDPVGIPVDLRTRFRWRAERRVRSLNARRMILSYHWRAVRVGNRFEVRAFQNYLVPR